MESDDDDDDSLTSSSRHSQVSIHSTSDLPRFSSVLHRNLGFPGRPKETTEHLPFFPPLSIPFPSSFPTFSPLLEVGPLNSSYGVLGAL